MSQDIQLKGVAGAWEPRTVEEFDVFLAKFAKMHPVRFAEQTASGEFERFRKKLIGYKPPAEVAPKKPVEKV